MINLRKIASRFINKNASFYPKLIVYNETERKQLPITDDKLAEHNITTKNPLNIFKLYEDVIGVTDVKKSQQTVINAENNFLRATDSRKVFDKSLKTLHIELNRIRNELDKTPRQNDKYLDLVTQEHNILKRQMDLEKEFKAAEEHERLSFQMLSSALRESHETEKIQNEKTKYISLVGSILGILLGFICSNVNNSIKMKQLKTLIVEQNGDKNKNGPIPIETSSNINNLTTPPIRTQENEKQLLEELQRQRQTFENFVTDMKLLLSLDVLRIKNRSAKLQTTPFGTRFYDSFYQFYQKRKLSYKQYLNDLPNIWHRILQNTTLLYSPIFAIHTNSNANNQGEMVTNNDINLNAKKGVEQPSKSVEKDMEDIKKALLSGQTDIVQLNFIDKKELLALLEANEQDLEWRLKMSSLAITVACYSIFALIFPVILAALRGSS